MNKRGKFIIGASFLIFIIILTVLLLSTTLSASQEKFNVKFDIKPGLSHQTLYITIKNLQDTQDNLDLTTILNDTDFDISKVKNVRFYQLKDVEYETPDYQTICNPYQRETENGTITIRNCTQTQIGSHIKTKQEWQQINLISNQKNSVEIKHKWEQVTIQKSGQEKDIIKFKLEFDNPIVKRKDGWGSVGIISLDLNGKNYIDLTNSSWWNSTWLRRKNVTIEGGTETLNNFTVFLNVTYNESMQEDFDDLRFLSAPCGNGTVEEDVGNELKYEFDKKVNSNYAGIWVKIPTLKTGSNTMCMYYNNPAVDTTENSVNAWDGNYYAIYHFNEAASNQSTVIDSKQNVNGTVSGSGIRSNTTHCMFGDCYTFFGGVTSGSAIFLDSSFDGWAEMTMEGFGYLTASSEDNKVLAGSVRTLSFENFVVQQDSGITSNYRSIFWDSGGTLKQSVSTGEFGLNKWNYMATSYNGNVLSYVNQSKTTGDIFASSSYMTGYKTMIGGVEATDSTQIIYEWEGELDEIRFSNINRIDAWLNRSYLNKNVNLVTFGAEETKTNIPPNHTTPLLTTPSGKNFHYENLTCYNQSTYDADGDIVTNIYNWYKNFEPLAVLNLPFETNSKDYFGYSNDGTIYGANFVAGKVGKALSFDGVDDYVNVSDSNSLDVTGNLTLESWIYPKDISGPHTFIVKGGENWVYVNYLLRTSGDEIEFKWYNAGFETHKTTNVNLAINNWYHIVAVHDVVNNIAKIYVNGEEKLSESTIKTKLANIRLLSIGADRDSNGNPFLLFNGSIDEVKIYPYALSAEQIRQRYEETKDGLTSSSKIVSQETTAGDKYMCQITPNDGEDDGITLNSSIVEIYWAITFDIRDSYSNVGLNGVSISCNYSGFNQAGDNTNPYGPYGFPPGNWECNFAKFGYYDKTQTFLANEDKTVNVKLSEEKQLTVEEHTWLEAIYNCVILGDCSLYNMLLEMNQTLGKIWEHTKPTDESVVTFENVTNKVVNSTSNLTIDYTVNIPIKAGYSLGTYLPVRIGYWFLNTANTTCYNQGDKPTGVEDPYCQPLIIETIGPMGGQVNFTVKLQPSLPAGDYSIKRIIDIDPNNVWINYGQEVIGSFAMAETLSTYGIGVEKTGDVAPEREVLLQNIKSKITGAVTGISQLLSGWQIVAIIAIIGVVFVVFIISRTVLKLKESSIKKKL